MGTFETESNARRALPERAPGIVRAWAEEYLAHVESSGASHYHLGSVMNDLAAFAMFLELSGRTDHTGHTGHAGLPDIPYWQYSAFLEWAGENIDEPPYRLRLDNARRLLGNIMDFYGFLVDNARIGNLREISRAYDYICGREELRLIDQLPYTGSGRWVKAVLQDGPLGAEATLTVGDYWLLLLYTSTGCSWEHMQRLAGACGSRASNARKLHIYNLKRKLRRIGFLEKPEDLISLFGPPSPEDMEKASRWMLMS